MQGFKPEFMYCIALESIPIRVFSAHVCRARVVDSQPINPKKDAPLRPSR